MTIEKHISALLYRFQCVTLPGFGAFISEIQSAKVAGSASTFNPPKKIIIFNNFHLWNISIQNVLKVILEKNTHIIFIVLTLNLSKIINPIK